MPKISPKNIAEAIYDATKGKSGIELESAIACSVQVLQEKHMLGKSEDVLQALLDIFEKKAGAVRMKITTANRMESGERKKLENEIKEKYKAQSVISEFWEKAELLGGMRVEVLDEVLDTTYKNKLCQLEKFLMQEK